MAKESETSTANAANANTNSTSGLVTAGAINEEIDKRSDVLEVDDRGTQDELEQEIEELKNKLQEAKEKTNALVIQLNEMKQQLVNFDNTVRQF